MTPTDPTPSERADLTPAMRKLQSDVRLLHENGPWGCGWDAAEAFAQGPDSGDETLALIRAALQAIEPVL